MKRTFPIARLVLAAACILPVFVPLSMPLSSVSAARQALTPSVPLSSASAARQALSTDEAQNEALVLRFLYEGLNQRNFAVLNDVLSPGFVSHTPFGKSVGIPAFEKVAGGILAAFPDVHITVLEVVASGDTVVVRDQTTATHKGPFLGVHATGKKVGWSEFQFWHLAHGKIVEEWVTFDTFGLLRQIKGS